MLNIKILNKLNKIDYLFFGLYLWSYIFSSLIFREAQINTLPSLRLSESLKLESILQYLPIVLLSLFALLIGILINKKNLKNKINNTKKEQSNSFFYISLLFFPLSYFDNLNFYLDCVSKITLLYSIYNLYINRVKSINKSTLRISYIVILSFFVRGLSKIAFAPLVWILIPLFVAFLDYKNPENSKNFYFKLKNYLNFRFFTKTFLAIFFSVIVVIFL